jgi:hypothetical protein
VPQLKYVLLAHFDDVFWVDPNLYPITRERQEENALEQFPVIRKHHGIFGDPETSVLGERDSIKSTLSAN